MNALPAFIQGIPGGMELVVILFMLFMLVVPVLAIGGAYLLYKRLRDGSQDRTAELEAKVDELEQELEAKDD